MISMYCTFTQLLYEEAITVISQLQRSSRKQTISFTINFCCRSAMKYLSDENPLTFYAINTF